MAQRFTPWSLRTLAWVHFQGAAANITDHFFKYAMDMGCGMRDPPPPWGGGWLGGWMGGWVAEPWPRPKFPPPPPGH